MLWWNMLLVVEMLLLWDGAGLLLLKRVACTAVRTAASSLGGKDEEPDP